MITLLDDYIYNYIPLYTTWVPEKKYIKPAISRKLKYNKAVEAKLPNGGMKSKLV